jgi:hypothetical protein
VRHSIDHQGVADSSANMLPHRPKPPAAAPELTDAEPQPSDEQVLPLEATSAIQASAGDKRKRVGDIGQPLARHKRQTFDLPFHGPARSDSENDGEHFLSTLFAVVSTNRMLHQRYELYQDCRGKYKRRLRLVESFETALDALENKTDIQPVSQQHLNERVEYESQLRIFVPKLNDSQEEASRSLREHDGLRDEVAAGVESLLLAYSRGLECTTALMFLKDNANFWKVLEARSSAGETVTKNTRAAFRAIEDERLTIRGRMNGRSKQVLMTSLGKASFTEEDASTSAPLANLDTTEQDVGRLSELVRQEGDLKYKERFSDVRKLRSQSEELLRIAERALVDAQLLAPDSNEGFRGGWYGKPKKQRPRENSESYDGGREDSGSDISENEDWESDLEEWLR